MELLDRIVVPLPCSGTREEVDKADDDDEGDEEEDDDVEDVDEALETRTPDCCWVLRLPVTDDDTEPKIIKNALIYSGISLKYYSIKEEKSHVMVMFIIKKNKVIQLFALYVYIRYFFN